MSALKGFCLIVAATLALTFVPAFLSIAQVNETEALHKQVIELYRARMYADAIPLAERLLAIREKSLGPDHPDIAWSLNNLALLYKSLGRYTDAEPLYKRASVIYENALGPVHPYVAAALNNLASLYDVQNLYADAEPLYKRSLAIYEKALGPAHRNVATALNNLALHYYSQDRYAEAEPLVRRTLELRSAEKSIAFPVLFQSGLLNLISTTDAFSRSFETVQRVASSAAVNSMPMLASRFVTGSDKALSDMIGKDRDLSAVADQLNKAILAAVSKPPTERNSAAEDQVRKRIDAIKLDRDTQRQIFVQRFPDYIALSNPRPLELKETQALLVDDEALVVFDFGPTSYAWIITRTDSYWVELNVTADTLDFHVKELLASLKADGNSFDSFLARWIYRETFEAFADKIASKTRWSVVTNGALASLPLHLLVTKDPGDKQYKDIDWLVRSHAITMWPSVASMKVLRGKTLVSLAPKSLVAFADPEFSIQQRKQPQNRVATTNSTNLNRSAQVDYDELVAALRQRPETGKEVGAVATALNADPSDIKLNSAATETAVKQGKLDQYRIVYFATHCLGSGLIEKFSTTKAEAALALTAPNSRNELDDGLLYLSEVAQLKLNADWVVLTGCVTATADEVLPGFARAFFYAGGRSLVVSHWEINDEQAIRLMTNLFQASARDDRLTHGQTLQQSMLAMLNNAQSDEEAHPRLWAPFSVIGEPAEDDSDACYKESSEAAIATCSRVITSGRYLGRKLAGLYEKRGLEFRKKGQFDRSLADYNEAIRIDPKYDSAFNRRCYLRAIIGQLQLALADCNVALRLSPENAASLETRGITYLKLGYVEQSIADFSAALRINPNLAVSLYGRGLAKQKKGDSIGGDADVAAANALTADIAEQFAKLGIQSTARVNMLPGYGGVRRNDESLVEDRHGVVH